MLGPPASGKGTMAEQLSKDYGLEWISVGELLRREARKDGERARKIRELVYTGKLLPFEIVNEVLKENLPKDNWIIDGYPRDIDQARFLQENIPYDLVIFIDLPKEKSRERIVYRRQCPKCGAVFNLKTNPPKNDETCDYCGTKLIQRKDDKEEVWSIRWKVYEEKTFPLKQFFQEKGRIEIVNGDQPIKDEYKEIINVLKRKGLIK